MESEDDEFENPPPPLPKTEEEETAEQAVEDTSPEPSQKLRSGMGERRAPRQLWLISYSDFMTILMIFFLAMYGYTYLAKAALLEIQQKTVTYSEFTTRIQEIEKTLGNQLKIQEDVDKVVIQLGEKILFPSGSASLAPAASATLAELAKSIILVEGDVIVQGHTDNVPIRSGHHKSNWELSAARAFSVISALTKNGVPPERLAAWGFGENRPLFENDTAENKAGNRRIEVIVLKKKGKA